MERVGDGMQKTNFTLQLPNPCPIFLGEPLEIISGDGKVHPKVSVVSKYPFSTHFAVLQVPFTPNKRLTGCYFLVISRCMLLVSANLWVDVVISRCSLDGCCYFLVLSRCMLFFPGAL